MEVRSYKFPQSLPEDRLDAHITLRAEAANLLETIGVGEVPESLVREAMSVIALGMKVSQAIAKGKRPPQSWMTLHELEVYPTGCGWAFDDPRREIVREPFVEGMPQIIDLLIEESSFPRALFTLGICDQLYSGAQISLTYDRSEAGGAWYTCPQYDLSGWFSHRLYDYYDAPPQTLYLATKVKGAYLPGDLRK